MLTSEELRSLRSGEAGSGDLTRFLQTLERRAAPVLERFPPVPRVKALLSRDGGVCPDDRSPLRFDPWSPQRHECPRCGRSVTGERHHRHWARAQHLWIAERAAELALLAALREDPEAAARAHQLIASYDELYFELPNRDNVLGPTHLFFSTYLESLWINSYLAAATLLRQAGLLPEERAGGVNRIAEEAANLIAEFTEGPSNRQTWHAAALAGIAVWFEDTELLANAVESRTGVVGHLADGFGGDGMWWEGENYHLFALRGLMQGIRWARLLDFDVLEDPEVRDHFRTALLAPARTALPDLTYPARHDSRFGVSLAHPASLELWEIGRQWLGPDEELESWLTALYGVPAPEIGEGYDAWLHDAGQPAPPPDAHHRTDLSWWVAPAIPLGPPRELSWIPGSVHLPQQGLVVLRQEDRYASLECGPWVPGHGHPSRLHLTVHAGGVHWLPDPGTGSYVQETLAWYRSALAHNAPLVDGQDGGGADAWCAGFEAGERFAWGRGRAGGLTRTIILSRDHLVDLLEFQDEAERELLLPWHFAGELRLETQGSWEPAELKHPFVDQVERDSGVRNAARVVQADAAGRSIRAHLLAPGAELLSASAPGLPNQPGPRRFLLLRARTRAARWITVLDFAPSDAPESITAIRADPEAVEIVTRSGARRFRERPEGLRIEGPEGSVLLAGQRPAPRPHRPLFERQPEPEAHAFAPRITASPELDGSLSGFDDSAPLLLDSEHQYRRSEEPWAPETFSAEAILNWDGESLYLAVQVHKPDLAFRSAEAPPLDRDNEPDDIHSDGLQVYLGTPEETAAVLIVPQAEGTLLTRPIGAGEPLRVQGTWNPTEDGYLVTVKLDHPLIAKSPLGAQLGFDLLVNEMRPERTRRAGQLVWSGGNGWIYLRGDRQDPRAFGALELG